MSKEGNPRAQGLLGMLTLQGGGVRKDVDEGVRLLQLSAEAGNAGGQGFLALLYWEGLHVQRDLQNAARFAELSAKQEHPAGQFVLSALLLRSRSEADWSRAVELLQKSSAKAFPPAQYQLGKLTALGWVVARDVVAGQALMDSAVKGAPALKPMAELMVSLQPQFDAFQRGALVPFTCDGFACAARWGGRQAEAKRHFSAEAWPELAAVVAQVQHKQDLPYFYLGASAEGMGFPSAAQTYYYAALRAPLKCSFFINLCDGVDVALLARTGWERTTRQLEAQAAAKRQRDEEFRLEQAEIARVEHEQRAQEAAQNQLRQEMKEAQQGNVDAQFALASRYLKGDGVALDTAASQQWMQRAAEAGHAEAQFQVASRLLGASGVRDERWAEALLRKASSQGHPAATELLASIQAARRLRERRAIEMEDERKRKFEAAQREQERLRRKESAEKVNAL